MSIKLVVSDVVTELDASKFFGEILLPEQWLYDDIFSPDEMFLCQINLDELSDAVGKTLLPESGMLYFFIDYKKKPLAVVRYTDGDTDAYTCFNEDWEGDYDVVTEYAIEFEKGDGETALLCSDENVADNEVALLRFVPDTDDIDFLSGEEKSLYFIIEKEALSRRDFSNVLLKIA